MDTGRRRLARGRGAADGAHSDRRHRRSRRNAGASRARTRTSRIESLMPVAIVGMHRSGTSLVAQVLAKAGLYLGRTDDLIPAGPDNPDGYWEHAGFHGLNES